MILTLENKIPLSGRVVTLTIHVSVVILNIEKGAAGRRWPLSHVIEVIAELWKGTAVTSFL